MTFRLPSLPSPAVFRVHPRRLLVAPRVEVTWSGPAGAEVAVHGLVCGVCAARTRSALLAVPGVQDACVDLDAGTATLSLAPGARLEAGGMERAMQGALEHVVLGMAARRIIERIAGTLRAVRPRRVERRGR